MFQLLIDTPPLVAVAAIFGLSLGGAYVLFRTLKAAAVVKTVRGQASGALAGFLMIFGALGGTYLKLVPTADRLQAMIDENARLEARIQDLQATLEEYERRTETWTLMGTIQREGAPSAAGAKVLLLPPRNRELADPHGQFTLSGLEVVNGSWPRLQVTDEGYSPEYLRLSEDQLELDEQRNLAILKEPVKLYLESPPDSGVVAADLEGTEGSTAAAEST